MVGARHVAGGRFRLGDRWITPDANDIDGTRVEAKSMDVLVALMEASPSVMSGPALLEQVWPDVVVVDNVVYQAVAQLRKALGDDSHVPRYIEPIPRRGDPSIARSNAERPVPRNPTRWRRPHPQESMRFSRDADYGLGGHAEHRSPPMQTDPHRLMRRHWRRPSRGKSGQRAERVSRLVSPSRYSCRSRVREPNGRRVWWALHVRQSRRDRSISTSAL